MLNIYHILWNGALTPIIIIFGLNHLIKWSHKHQLFNLSQIQICSLSIEDQKFKTPSMAGVILVPWILLSIIIWNQQDTFPIHFWLILSYFFIGLWDDIHKFKKIPNYFKPGLKSIFKLILEVTITLIIGYYYQEQIPKLYDGWGSTTISIILYCFTMISIANASNIIDGIDGFCGSQHVLSILLFIAFFIFYPSITLSPNISSFPIPILTALISILLFLKKNTYPAKIFLGDSGSLPLGVLIGHYFYTYFGPVLFFCVISTFTINTLSSLIQIIGFRCFKFRPFKIAPIHHLYQTYGWSENKVVLYFLVYTLLPIIVLWKLLWTIQ